MAITPSGIDYFKLKPEDIVIMDLDGNIIDGIQKPSSEYSMHKIFFTRGGKILILWFIPILLIQLYYPA